MKVAEISGDLFASCSNQPKCGKKCDEFKSLYQNILKLLFCGHVSLLQGKRTPLQIPPRMEQRHAIWRRSRIGSALVRVGQPICSEYSAMATYLFHRSGLKHYSAIRLLTLCVKFDRISRRTPELEHLPWTAFIRCVGNILFPIKAPFAKTMYLLTCWKYTQSHVFISPCRNDPSQLQNCRIKRFFTVFGTLRVTWPQRKAILSPTHPNTHTPTHPKTEYVLSLFCNLERFIRFDTWGTAPLQRLCQNMVRTWYTFIIHLELEKSFDILKALGKPKRGSKKRSVRTIGLEIDSELGYYPFS